MSTVAHPEFAKEVRLGLATDGLNPFSNLSTNQSVWPVILVPYNLPASLCMRKEFSMLSLLIPGPKAPSNDINVFLAPLIEELKELWVEGVKAFESYKQKEFTLKVMLLWAIHDFSAYGTLSGCNVHGYFDVLFVERKLDQNGYLVAEKFVITPIGDFCPSITSLGLIRTIFSPVVLN